MGALLVILLPGALAAILHGRICGHVKRAVCYFPIYEVSVNLSICMGLWAAGVNKFDLRHVSFKFLAAWFTAGILLSGIFLLLFMRIQKLKKAEIVYALKEMTAVVFFFVVTYVIFIPSSLFLTNINEFAISYKFVVPSLCAAAAVFMAAFAVIAICVTAVGKKIFSYFVALLFAVTLSMYLQNAFLNPSLPALDGTLIDWNVYAVEKVISAIVWMACMAGAVLAVWLLKGKVKKLFKGVSYFLGVVQLTSLVVLLFTCRLDKYINFALTKDGEFTIGREENVVIFIVDTLGGETMNEYLENNHAADTLLENFTYFDNAVSGGTNTSLGVPLILTGVEYDPMQSIDDYNREVWEETQLYDDLEENHYDIRFYSDGVPEFMSQGSGHIKNASTSPKYQIMNYPLFTKSFYQLVNFNVMPQQMKEQFWLSTEELTKYIGAADGDYYRLNDAQFYMDFKDAGALAADYERTFRFYHFSGVHMPYTLDENAEYTEENVTEQQQLQGNMKIIYEYLEAMKKAGVYDCSTIIIAGDHGRHEDGSIEANPALIIKSANEKHAFKRDPAPVHFRNVVAAMAGTVLDDYTSYGPSVYDITEGSDVERMHTVTSEVRDRWTPEISEEYLWECARFIIPEQVNLVEDYREWKPYEINSLPYKIGELIDFEANNEYADQIRSRCYKEAGGGYLQQ